MRSRAPSLLQLLLAATFFIFATGCTMTVRPTSHRSAEVAIGEPITPVKTSGDPNVRWSRHHDAPPERPGKAW